MKLKIQITSTEITGIIEDLALYAQVLSSTPILNKILESVYTKIIDSDSENEEFRLIVEKYMFFNTNPEKDKNLFEEDLY